MRGAGRPNDFHQLLDGRRRFLIRSISFDPTCVSPARPLCSPRATENVVPAVGGGAKPPLEAAAVVRRVGAYEDEPAVVSTAVRGGRDGAAAVVRRELWESAAMCWRDW